jgi:hypothetical protein
MGSKLTTSWSTGEEPAPAYCDHLYAGARHIGNVIPAGLSDAIYGARWHWAGAQMEHSAPLFSPNADTAGWKGYNIARAQSPQQATWATPTTAGDNKLLYGQGRPMAKSASGAGAGMSSGTLSKDQGSGTVQVSSRLFFDGTVAGGGTANDLSRLTDAREKGRIGIFGSALSSAGAYGRVTSESLGCDLNPLGRGDDGSYVAGGMNLGRISPCLPRNLSPGGWGNSVNNGCEDGGGGISGGGTSSLYISSTSGNSRINRDCYDQWATAYDAIPWWITCQATACLYACRCHGKDLTGGGWRKRVADALDQYCYCSTTHGCIDCPRVRGSLVCMPPAHCIECNVKQQTKNCPDHCKKYLDNHEKAETQCEQLTLLLSAIEGPDAGPILAKLLPSDPCCYCGDNWNWAGAEQACLDLCLQPTVKEVLELHNIKEYACMDCCHSIYGISIPLFILDDNCCDYCCYYSQ